MKTCLYFNCILVSKFLFMISFKIDNNLGVYLKVSHVTQYHKAVNINVSRKKLQNIKGGARSSRRNVIKDHVEITCITRRGRFPQMSAANSPVFLPPSRFRPRSVSFHVFAFSFIFIRLFWLLQTGVVHFILKSTRVSHIFFFSPGDVYRRSKERRWPLLVASATAAKEYRDSRAHKRSRM